MTTVLARQGNVQMYLDTAHSVRTLTIQMGRKHEDASITLTPEDLPAVALQLLRSVPTTPYSANLDGAVCCLVQYLNEQEAKQAEAKLRNRRDMVAGELFASLDYDQLDEPAQAAVDRIIDLEDKLEAQKAS